MKHIKHLAIILFLIGLSACAQVSPALPVDTPAYAPPANAPQPTETATVFTPAPTVIPNLLGDEPFSSNSTLCGKEDTSSQFLLTCTDNILLISESENRRGSNIVLTREQVIDTRGFDLQAQITSDPADKNKLDKNQAGFYFVTDNNNTIAVRIEGQYFNFEEWYVEGGKDKIRAYNQSYSPAILSAGRKNDFRLVCEPENCDFFANEELAGRLPFKDYGRVKAIGFFTASDWDQRFGTIMMKSLSVTPLSTDRPEMKLFSLFDNLQADNGTFSQMGLSGAFSDFEPDGFHFSPVIPYGYYGAKADPSLRNVSISATVNMDFEPGKPATRYGGVVCRASNEGMYLAILRVDGTYMIFRDSIRKPFAMLAKDSVESIVEGRSSNKIQLDCFQDTISLYINDIQVESFTDTKYDINYGRCGLYTKAGGLAYSDAIIFRDLEIKEIR